MDSSATTGIEVTLSAIDGGYLVLESVDDKSKFLWPLDKIPRPLEIGSRLTLALQKDIVPAITKTGDKTHHGKADKNPGKDEQMRRLLEELVN